MRDRTPLFGGLPERGIWTPIGLSRAQFFLVLTLSVLLFLLVGGPLWTHLHEGHFTRITVSYGVIPPAVALALHRNGSARPLQILVASGVLALVKLVLTAALLVVIALARS